MNSGLLEQTSDGNGENMMAKGEDDDDAPQLLTSNMAIKTDDIDTDDEATQQDKELMPQEVTSNVAMKTDDIDTDDEATQQDKDDPTPQPVASNKAIKTDDIDTDTDDEIDTQQLRTTTSAKNLTMNVSAATSDDDDAMVLKFFQKFNSFIEHDNFWFLSAEIEEMIKANNYLVNAKCPQKMEYIEVGLTAMEALCCLHLDEDILDLLYALVCLGGKATEKCYELVMASLGNYSSTIHHIEVLLLSGYFPTEKGDFFLDALAEGFEFEKEDENKVSRILHKDISLRDNLICGVVNSTIINNINGLPPLKVGETHSEGGPMEKLMNRFPCEHIICSTCKAPKLAWRFSEEHKCCYECERRDFLECSKCGVSKRRLDYFTADQREGEYWARCIECVNTQKDRI